MAIADWIREATDRRKVRVIEEVRSSEEYRQAWRDGYLMGYDDADKGRPFGFSLDALDNKSSGKRKAG